jgi:hypothetical protein
MSLKYEPSSEPLPPCLVFGVCRCRVIDKGLVGSTLGGVPREQTMLKGHLPMVVYHQVY